MGGAAVVERTPVRAAGYAVRVGILRLRGGFASRTRHFAQDDSGWGCVSRSGHSAQDDKLIISCKFIDELADVAGVACEIEGEQVGVSQA